MPDKRLKGSTEYSTYLPTLRSRQRIANLSPERRDAHKARVKEYSALWACCNRVARREDYRKASITIRHHMLLGHVKAILEKRRRDGQVMCGWDPETIVEKHLKKEADIRASQRGSKNVRLSLKGISVDSRNNRIVPDIDEDYDGGDDEDLGDLSEHREQHINDSPLPLKLDVVPPHINYQNTGISGGNEPKTSLKEISDMQIQLLHAQEESSQAQHVLLNRMNILGEDFRQCAAQVGFLTRQFIGWQNFVVDTLVPRQQQQQQPIYGPLTPNSAGGLRAPPLAPFRDQGPTTPADAAAAAPEATMAPGANVAHTSPGQQQGGPARPPSFWSPYMAMPQYPPPPSNPFGLPAAVEDKLPLPVSPRLGVPNHYAHNDASPRRYPASGAPNFGQNNFLMTPASAPATRAEGPAASGVSASQQNNAQGTTPEGVPSTRSR